MLEGLLSRLRTMFRRDRIASEMEEELRQHLDESTELMVRRGMSPDEARLAARNQLGNATIIAEDARAALGGRVVDDLRRDLQHGIRALRRTPGFTAVVIVTLALGFGVNGAIFAVLKGAMTPKSIAEAETWLNIPDHWSWEDAQRIGRDMRSMTEWSVTADETVVLGGDARGHDPRTIRAQFVTDGFIPSLRGRAALGRIFAPSDVVPPIGNPVAVLSHSLWRRRFNSDSSIIGRDIRLADGQPFVVIGVMPERFTGLSLAPPDLWLPLGTRARLPDADDTRDGAAANWFGPSGRRFLFLHARLAPGASLAAARSELRLRIEQVSAPADSTRGRDVASYTNLATRLPINGADDMAFVGLVLGAAISVLLIASVTVANLMLARAAARRREMGVRLALGASRGRVLRSWMTECSVLSLAAAVVGVVMASWTVRTIVLGPTFSALVRDGDPLVYLAALAPDASVFMYLVLLSIPSTLVFGLVPALRATRQDPLTTMRGASASGAGSTVSTGRVFLRRGLVVSQVALTMVLLLTSAMMVRGVQVMSRVDTGFNRDHVIAVSPKLVHSGYDSVRADRFMEELLGRLASVPGVRQVTRGNVPMHDRTFAFITNPNEPVPGERTSNGHINSVSETFFDVLDIEIVRGRTFTRAEVLNRVPVAVISESTGETLWPDQEPIGKVISATSLDQYSRKELRDGTFAQARVIGVARDAQMSGFGMYPRRYVYLPGDHATPMLRTNGDPEVMNRVRAMTRLIDPNVIVDVRTLDQAVLTSSGWVESARLIANSAASAGILSLLMALVGLFGLTSYMVEQRTREFGVRMALGARSGSVLRLVAGQSLRLVAIGAAIGVVSGIAMTGLLRSAMFGLRNTEPLMYVLIVVLLAAVSILACGIPAWRATRVEPMVALRTD
jgi:macrolide transport system ATP-binding/permease protein